MSQYQKNKYQKPAKELSLDDKQLIQTCLNYYPVDKEAEDFAWKIQSITSSQFRKFYNEFKTLERQYETLLVSKTKEEAFKTILPKIKITKAKIDYASSRPSLTIPLIFKEWFRGAIDKINSAENFESFLLHFEAVVGYAYGAGLRDNK